MIDCHLNNIIGKKVCGIVILCAVKITTFVSKNTKGQIICHIWLL